MDKDSLLQSINEYESQLEQIHVALEGADEENKDNLLSLKNDILQLIDLTKESLNTISSQELCREDDGGQCTSEATNNIQHIDDEYSLFLVTFYILTPFI